MDETKLETLRGVDLNTRIITRVEKIFGKFRFYYRDVRFEDGLLVDSGYPLFLTSTLIQPMH